MGTYNVRKVYSIFSYFSCLKQRSLFFEWPLGSKNSHKNDLKKIRNSANLNSIIVGGKTKGQSCNTSSPCREVIYLFDYILK